MPVARGSFHIGCHALIERNGRYLLMKRSAQNDYMPLYWDLPGGRLEFGEDLRAGMLREVREEANLRIKPQGIISHYNLHWPKRNIQILQLTFQARYVSGAIRLNPEEHSEYVWIQKKDFKKYRLMKFVKELTKQWT